MATLVQFFNSDKIARITVITGRDPVIVRLAVDEALNRQSAERIDMFTSAQAAAIHLVELTDSLFADKLNELIIVHNMRDDLEPLERVAQHVSDDIRLLIVLGEKPDEKPFAGVRDVQYVDCPRLLDHDGMVKIARHSGLSEPDAEWLVSFVHDDIDSVISALELLNVFPKPWPERLIRAITPPPDTTVVHFKPYLLFTPGSDAKLCELLSDQFEKYAVLSYYLPNKLGMLELMRKTSFERFQLSQAIKITVGTTPKQWMEKIGAVRSAQRYAQHGFPVREYLRARLMV